MNEPTPQQDPIDITLQSYRALRTKHDSLTALMGNYTDPTILSTFEEGKALLDTQLNEAQISLTTRQEEIARGIQDLELLRGVLPDTVLESRLNELKQRGDKIGSVTTGRTVELVKVEEEAGANTEIDTSDDQSTYAKQHDTACDSNDLSSETVITTNTENSVPKTPERKTEKQQVTMKLVVGPQSSILRIGEKGRVYRLTTRLNEGQADYTAVRKAGLEFMIANQHREIFPHEIWDHIVGTVPGKESDESLDTDTMKYVRTWLTSIRHRNSYLFLHNDKRGRGSRYRTNPSFDMSLNVVESADVPFSELIEQAALEDIDKITPTSTETDMTYETAIIIGDENDIPVVESVIPVHSAAILTGYLDMHRDLLAHLGIPVPSKELCESIAQADERRSMFDAKLPSPKTPDEIKEERALIMRSMRAVLQNQDLFEALMLAVRDDDTIYPLVEYLFSLEEEQWSALINQVLQAETELMRTVSFAGDMTAQTRSCITRLPNGRTFEQIIGEDTHQPLIEITISRPVPSENDEDDELYDFDIVDDADLPLPEIEGSGLGNDSFDESPDLSAAEIAGQVTPIDSAPSLRGKNTGRKQVPDKLQQRLDAVKLAIADDNAPKSGTVMHLVNYYRWITTKNVREALENNIIPKRNSTPAELNLEEIILIGLWKADSSWYGVRGNKRTVDNAVASVLAAIEKSSKKPNAN